MAGLRKWQRGEEGTVSRVFVILTTSANVLMAPIHDRMPIILDDSQLDKWMAADGHSRFLGMLVPAPDESLVAEPVSPLIISVKNDGPELLSSA
jgi:putative SOS response-associated peptidase YedK